MNPRARLTALIHAGEAIPLDEAALLIAAEEYPALDVDAWLRRLDRLGSEARARLQPHVDAPAAVHALNSVMFQDHAFRGNRDEYYDPRNSFLNEVLDRELGIPITLSLVYMEVGRRAGLTVRGVGLPGHFVVRAERRGTTCLLDPFDAGRVLSMEDCARLVMRATGADVSLGPRHLEPVEPRELLARLLRNLKAIYLERRDWRRTLLAVDRILLLQPSALGELRDRGLLHASLGAHLDAVADLEGYLRARPDAPDAAEVRGRLRAVRQVLGALN